MISVIGMGKLGLPLAAFFAKNGYRVIGVDIDKEKIQAINAKTFNSMEPFLTEYISTAEQLEATDDYGYTVENSEITFIMVNTGVEGPEGYGAEKLVKCLVSLKEALKDKKEGHIMVLVSTVLPGTMRSYVAPFFKDMDVAVLYNPVWPAIGNVVRYYEAPDFVTIGGEDPDAMRKVADIWRRTTYPHQCTIRLMTWENAELIKLAVNFFCCMKITFANILAEMCEKTENANVNVVTDTLGLDSRISPKFLKAGLGYGGPCFPKDDRAFITLVANLGMDTSFPSAVRNVNLHQIDRILKKIPPSAKVAVLGVTFKPGVDILWDSQAWEIVERLKARGAGVLYYDPGITTGAKDLKEALEDAEVVLIATPWPEFKKMKSEDFPAGCTVIDCWRIFNRDAMRKRVKYIEIGRY